MGLSSMSSQPPPIPLDYSVIPFELVEEHWNEYSFSDGTIILFRTIVIRIARRKGSPAGQYDITTNNIATIMAPPTERGQPSPLMTPDEIQSAEKFEVRPITTEEHWNVYRLRTTDEMIKVKYVASNFYKVKGKFDQFGEPVYLVVGGPLVVPQPKSSKSGMASQ